MSSSRKEKRRAGNSVLFIVLVSAGIVLRAFISLGPDLPLGVVDMQLPILIIIIDTFWAMGSRRKEAQFSACLNYVIIWRQFKNMSKSEYEKSLDFLIKVYNIFVHRGLSLLKKHPRCSQTLKELLGLWVHPKGMFNIVTSMTLHYQAEVPHPSVERLQQDVVPQTPLKTQIVLKYADRQLLYEDQDKSQSKYSEKEVKKEQDELFQEEEEDRSEGSSVEVAEVQSAFCQSDEVTYKRGPYKSYSKTEKRHAVQLYFSNQLSITEISRQLGIPCKNIKRWSTEGVDRKRGGGRKKTNPFLEDQVYRWINKQHSFGDTIQIEEIQQCALSRSNDSGFKASRGWAIKFVERFNLRSRYAIM